MVIGKWSMGLGLNDEEFYKFNHIRDKDLLEPMKIPLFYQRKIMIKDIQCGSS